MDVATLQGTITSLKSASDILKSLIDLKEAGKIKPQIIELQNAIMTAQDGAISAKAAQLSVIEEISDLKKEVADMKTWEREKERYKLIPIWEGAVVYAVKESMKNSEPPHYICTNCYENGRKSILTQHTKNNNFIELVCPTCKACLPSIVRHSKGFPLNYA